MKKRNKAGRNFWISVIALFLVALIVSLLRTDLKSVELEIQETSNTQTDVELSFSLKNNSYEEIDVQVEFIFEVFSPDWTGPSAHSFGNAIFQYQLRPQETKLISETAALTRKTTGHVDVTGFARVLRPKDL